MKNDRLKAHLDAAYRVAQAITLDTHAASELVERAYHNAYADNPDAWPDEEVRERLIRHVLAAHKADVGTGSATVGETTTQDLGEERGSRYRAQVARDTIDRLLPTALALLPERLRTTLVLVETENLSAHDAARILETDATSIQQDRDAAYALLREGLMRGAGEVERELLNHEWREEWLRQALVRHARTRFAPPPPTLVLPRPRIITTEVELPARPDRRSRHRERHSRNRIGGLAIGLAMIVGAGLIGYVASDLLESEPDLNIVTLSASRIEAVEMELQSTSAGEIERFLRQEHQSTVRIPHIEQASLVGAGKAEVARDVQVPVVIYRDGNSGEQIPVFVYSYAMLDRYPESLRLEKDVMQHIEDEHHFDLHDLGDARVLIWRNRDEIFLAATRGDASELQDRITPTQ